MLGSAQCSDSSSKRGAVLTGREGPSLKVMGASWVLHDQSLGNKAQGEERSCEKRGGREGGCRAESRKSFVGARSV